MQNNSTMVASLYIPIINAGITQEYIAKCFLSCNIGIVSHVDFVLNKVKHRREAFVHFSEWYNNDSANKLKKELLTSSTEGKQCRFTYNGAQYWPLRLNKNPLNKNNPERKSNSVYELEERILMIEKSIEQLSFMGKLHDANIRYILHKNTNGGSSSVVPQIKRFKTEDGASSSSLKRQMLTIE